MLIDVFLYWEGCWKREVAFMWRCKLRAVCCDNNRARENTKVIDSKLRAAVNSLQCEP